MRKGRKRRRGRAVRRGSRGMGMEAWEWKAGMKDWSGSGARGEAWEWRRGVRGRVIQSLPPGVP